MTSLDLTPQPHASGVRQIHVGSAPDSWGVWFPRDPAQLPWHQFLDEIAIADYDWLELGPYGYLPTDPAQLAEELSSRGLTVSGANIGGCALHQPSAWESVVSATREIAQLAAAVNAPYLILIPAKYRDKKTGQHLEPAELDAVAWRRLTTAAEELGKIIAGDYGIRLAVHPSVETHLEKQHQVERLLNDTDPRHVSLCLDTGHLAYGGADTVQMLRQLAERIEYVHIKQIDPAIVAVAHRDGLSWLEAAQRGVCVEPPLGKPDLGEVADAIRRLPSSQVFVIVEQDLYPCDPATPLPIATRTRQLLRQNGLG